jgi:hypothetical protein
MFYFVYQTFRYKDMSPQILKKAFFTPSAVEDNFYTAFSAWNLNLNLKSNKIWKNKKNNVSKTFCLSDVSLQRYDYADFGPI